MDTHSLSAGDLLGIDSEVGTHAIILNWVYFDRQEGLQALQKMDGSSDFAILTGVSKNLVSKNEGLYEADYESVVSYNAARWPSFFLMIVEVSGSSDTFKTDCNLSDASPLTRKEKMRFLS